jgi:uncharacterized protein (TIGR03067 family)
MVRTIFASVVLFLLAVPARDREPSSEDEQMALSGTWSVTSAVTAGREVPAAEIKKLTITIEGKKFTRKYDDRVQMWGVLTVDPTTQPRSFELTAATGSYAGKTQLGIYRWEHGSVCWCFGRPGDARPKAFASKGAGGPIVERLKRQSK